jgi:hypothetical protein
VKPRAFTRIRVNDLTLCSFAGKSAFNLSFTIRGSMEGYAMDSIEGSSLSFTNARKYSIWNPFVERLGFQADLHVPYVIPGMSS